MPPGAAGKSHRRRRVFVWKEGSRRAGPPPHQAGSHSSTSPLPAAAGLASAEATAVLAQLAALQVQLARVEGQLLTLEAPLHRYLAAREPPPAAQTSTQAGPEAPQWDGWPDHPVPPIPLVAKEDSHRKTPQDKRRERLPRTVHIRHLPPGTSRAALQLLFPTADPVNVYAGPAHCFAYLAFPTVEEARAVAALGQLEVDGGMASVCMAVTGENDNGERTVFIGGLPLAVAEDDLRAVFPTAEAIHVKDGRMYAQALVTFGSVEEAQALALPGNVDFNGQRLPVRMAAPRRKREVEPEEKGRTVYVGGLPHGTVAAEVSPPFPTAERVEVRRGKGHAYGFVLYPTREEALQVAGHGQVVFDGAVLPLRVADDAAAHQHAVEERERRRVFLRGLPVSVTYEELRRHFPMAETVEIRRYGGQAHAWVTLPTEEEAQTVADVADIHVAGYPVPISMADGSRPQRLERAAARRAAAPAPGAGTIV
eukprot:EG_transcript_9379